MPNIKKSVTRQFLTAFLVTGLVLVLTLNFGEIQVSAQSGLIVVIGSDTTWTKAGSPYNLTGPVLVNQGVTLTIEAGVTVDLNGYDVLVNGTLCAVGGSANKIHILDSSDIGYRQIKFTKFSSDWDEQTGSGCILENTVIESAKLYVNCSLKLSNNEIFVPVTVGGCSPIIVDNIVNSINVNDASPTISNNDITYQVSFGGSDCSPVISDNFIKHGISGGADVAGGSPVITNNIVDADVSVGGVSAIILGNTINGTLKFRGHGGSPLISNNTITPPSQIIDSGVWIVPNYTEWYPGIILEGSNEKVTICNNALSGCSSGIELRAQGSVIIEGNLMCLNTEAGITDYGSSVDLTIIDNTFEHTNYGIDDLKSGTIQRNLFISNSVGMQFVGSQAVIQNNTFTENDVGLDLTGCPSSLVEANFLCANNVGLKLGLHATVRNNTFTNNQNGIVGTSGESATIERNYMSGNDYAIQISSQATITNNTIVDTSVAILLKSCPSATINYNNIENYNENSICLEDTSSRIDATYNWWGTTDIQAINLTIRDYKYVFELGKVTFIPVLLEPNSEATSDLIPEFPAWIVLPLFLVATLAVVVCKKRLSNRRFC
ncbi:MAG: right-handed parallel beta-helix repeat-containing protein [Candidatus Bathyarchaeota archaeon]|nr:right-handed parallel beta-helix repeat-containing protein [Candidatus Bathyarchaeum sp.]